MVEPGRKGTVGIAIGFSGVPGIIDMRGKEDIFKYHLKITMIAAADELARLRFFNNGASR